MSDNMTPDTSGSVPSGTQGAVQKFQAMREAREAEMANPEAETPTEEVVTEELAHEEAVETEDGEAETSPESEELVEESEAPDQPEGVLVNGEWTSLEEIAELKGTLADKVKNLEGDYTRKTQALADERRKMQADFASRAAQLNSAAETILPYLPQAPDPALAQSDPYEYTAQKARYEETQQAIAQTLQAQQQHQAEELNRMKRESVEYFTSGYNPEWKTPKDFMDKGYRPMMDYAVSKGFTKEELSTVVDKRMLEVLWEAKQFRDLSAGKPKVKVKAPPRVTKAAPKKPQLGAVQQAEQRFAKATGTRARTYAAAEAFAARRGAQKGG